MAVVVGVTCCAEVFEGVGLALTFSMQQILHPVGDILQFVGLTVQICQIMAFFAISGLFWRRYRKTRTQDSVAARLLIGITFSTGLISVASICRLVKACAMPTQISRLGTPLWLYSAEGASILANSLLWNVCNIARALSRPGI